MWSNPASNDAVLLEQVRLERAALVRGRPCVVVAWFARPEPEVGIARPPLVAALAVDPDGQVYEDLDRKEVGDTIEHLRGQAAALLEG